MGIGRALTRRLQVEASPGSAALSSAEGMILALAGVRYESPNLIVSLAHALALPAVLARSSGAEAYAISGFVRGEAPFDDVPALLRRAGVFSVLRKTEALSLAAWCQSNLGPVFDEEVASMQGPDAVADYRAEAHSLIRILQSTQTHDSDLCCWTRSDESK